MIEVKHVSKEFVSPKKYPGLKGAIKGLFNREKVRKVAVDDISFTIGDGEIVGYIGSNGARIKYNKKEHPKRMLLFYYSFSSGRPATLVSMDRMPAKADALPTNVQLT